MNKYQFILSIPFLTADVQKTCVLAMRKLFSSAKF